VFLSAQSGANEDTSLLVWYSKQQRWHVRMYKCTYVYSYLSRLGSAYRHEILAISNSTHNWMFVNSLLMFLKTKVNICERNETVSATGKKRIGRRGCITDSFAPDVVSSYSLCVFEVQIVQEERRYFLWENQKTVT
jgi:hypothetical protein